MRRLQTAHSLDTSLAVRLPAGFMKKYLDYLWPLIGLVAVIWSVELLWDKLKTEALTNEAMSARLEHAGLWDSIAIVAGGIGQKIALIPPAAFFHAGLATLVAYAALAWYDRIALLHLGKEKGISWPYISLCSFVTYALSHNIGASVFSGALVRYRAYTSKGLSAPQVAVLVALCSFTFGLGTILLGGLVLTINPNLLSRLEGVLHYSLTSPTTARIIGFALLAFVVLYVIGSLLHLKPITILKFRLDYPRPQVMTRQLVAAPLELIGAAGIIYFALPAHLEPSFLTVLAVFLASFSAALASHAPGGLGVFEIIFITAMPDVPKPDVLAALLIFRLFYLLIPFAIAIVVVLLFERARLAHAWRDRMGPEAAAPPPGTPGPPV